MRPLILTSASTGGFWTRADTPYLPVTCAEMIDDCVAACRAGASVLHLHARDESGKATHDPKHFAPLLGGLRKECPKVILQMSAGGIEGRTFELLEPMLALRPDVASFNLKGTAEETAYMYETFAKYNVKPIFEIFSMEMMARVADDFKAGRIADPALIEIVFDDFSMNGFSDCVRILLDLLARMPEGAIWSVTRGGRHAQRIMALAAALGGDIRTGIEDSLELDEGVLAKRSAELIERAIQILKLMGRDIATPDEAKSVMGL